MPFCDQCGRRLEPFARFCDLCGSNVAFVAAPPPPQPVAPPQDWSSYVIVRFPEAQAFGPTAPEPARVESKPVEPWPPPQPSEAQPSPVRARRFHISRRALAFSAGTVALIVIVALAFLSGAIVLPPLPGISVQTLSQTVATQGTSRTLQVQINIQKNPISLPSMQAISVTVLDPSGAAVQNASVHIDLVSPSGQTVAFDGLTDTNGHYSCSLHISASSDNVGTFKVAVVASKDGYQAGQAQTKFQATAPPS